MNIFKTYYKIINYNKKMIFLMLIISVVITSFIAKSYSNEMSTTIDTSKIKVGYIKKSDNVKNDALEQYLNSSFKTTIIKDTKQDINDALYYRAVDYIVVIDNKLSSYQQPNSTNGYLVDSYINNFTNTYHTFESTNKYSNKEIAKLTLKNLDSKVKVIYPKKDSNSYDVMVRYFNIYVYGLVGAIILGVGYVISALDKEVVLKRTIASSLSIRQRNLQILLGHITFGLFCWFLLSLISFFMFKDIAFSQQHLLLLFNSLIFLFPITALAFLISQIVKNYVALGAVNNVLTLGLSFISGAFVPQSILSPVVLKVASFTPTYWFILGNERSLDLNFNSLLQPITIQLGFALMFVCIGLAITRLKQNNNSY